MKLTDPEIGAKFGRLTVLGNSIRVIKWPRVPCVCDCGNFTSPDRSPLLRGIVLSCGCLSRDTSAICNRTHGGVSKKEKLHGIHASMLARCRNPQLKPYKSYGGRGITFCDEWLDYAAFRDWALANGYQENLSLDRIDNNGNYEPSNCRWATKKEQAANRRVSVIRTAFGKTLCLQAWSREPECVVSYHTLWHRVVNLNEDIITALITPAGRLYDRGYALSPIVDGANVDKKAMMCDPTPESSSTASTR